MEQQQNLKSVLAAVHDALAVNGAATAASKGLGPSLGTKRSGGLSPPPAAKRPRSGYMPLGLDGSDSESDSEAEEGGEGAVTGPAVEDEMTVAAPAGVEELPSAAVPGVSPEETAGLGQNEPSLATLPALSLQARSLGSFAGGGVLSGPRLTGKCKAVISAGGSDLTTAECPERQSSVSYPANSFTDGGGGDVQAALASIGGVVGGVAESASAALSANGPSDDAAAALSETGLVQESHVTGAAPPAQAEPSIGSKVMGNGSVSGVEKSSIVNCATVEEDVIAAKAVPSQSDIQAMNSVHELEGLGLDVLKATLQQWGLKCGGNAAERAARLYLLKSTPLEQMNRKYFAKAK